MYFGRDQFYRDKKILKAMNVNLIKVSSNILYTERIRFFTFANSAFVTQKNWLTNEVRKIHS